MNPENTFFEYAAEVGLTKHLGGVDATDKLAELCRISSDSYILDVGCGAGVTAGYLVKEFGCRVVGVDILEKMVQRSRERAQKEKITDKAEFRVADAQELPFEDNLFDAVITESVTAFPADKLKAVQEYARVTKPGGYVGLNESTWLKAPVPPDVADWASQEVGTAVNPLTSEEWQRLLTQAGLKDIFAKTSPIHLKTEAKGIVKRYGLGGMLSSALKGFRLYRRNPNYREFVKRIKEEGIEPENLEEYFGYGVYIGKK